MRRSLAPSLCPRLFLRVLVMCAWMAAAESVAVSATSADFEATSAAVREADAAYWERLDGGLGGATSGDPEARDDAGATSFASRLAVHGEVVAWSDARGVVRRDGERRERAALAEVTALVFDGAGTLWIGSTQGLYRWAKGARLERRRLFGGEAANRILDAVALGPRLAVATEGGLFWSPDPQGRDRGFQPLDAAALGTSVNRVAIRAASADSASSVAEVWTARAGALERIVGLPTDAGLRVVARDRVVLPRHGDVSAPVDLRVAPGPDGDRLVLAQADAILHRRLGAPGARLDAQATWTIDRPALAPGARIQRFAILDTGAAFVATNRGLFESSGIASTYRRATGEAGFESCTDIVSGPGRAPWASCRSGLSRRVVGARIASIPALLPVAAVGAIAAPPSPLSTARPAPIAPDPPLPEIRARALAYARLDRARGERLFRGLARRGFWPEVSLRFGADVDRDVRRHADQAFVSGDTRHLFDQTRDRGTGFDVALEFDWALGEIAYPDEAVDLSREHRQVVSLRDDIADELHQLYFERARLRARLAAGPSPTLEEERALRHRAAELLAGLDAWTGGWLSAWHADRQALDRLHTRSSGPDTKNGSPDP